MELVGVAVNIAVKGLIGASDESGPRTAADSSAARGDGVCGVNPDDGGRMNELLEPGGPIPREPPGNRAANVRGFAGAVTAPANAARLSCGISCSGGGGIGVTVSGARSSASSA